MAGDLHAPVVLRSRRLAGTAAAVMAALWLLAAASPAQAGLLSGCGGAGAPKGQGCHAAIDDAGRVYFHLPGGVVAGTESEARYLSLYTRAGGETRLVARTPDGTPAMANLVSLSDSGSRVLVFMADPTPPGPGWKAANYEYDPAAETLSVMPQQGQIQVTKDGGSLILATAQPLVPWDTDSDIDLYRRRGDEVVLITAAAAPVAEGGTIRYLSSASGDRIYYLAASDRRYEAHAGETKGMHSIWVWDRGVSRLVTDAAGLEGSAATVMGGVSDDGAELVFSTVDALSPGDTDANLDVYRHRLGEGFDLMSTGPADRQAEEHVYSNLASAEQISADGSRVFFWSTEQLVAADTDEVEDIYMRADGTTTLISRGTPGRGPLVPGALPFLTFGGVSDDGRHVAFETSHPVLPADEDQNMDVYEWADGELRLVTVGTAVPPGSEGFFQAISRSGRRIVFQAVEQLSPADNDSAVDFYVSEESAPPSARAVASRAAPRRRIRLVSVEAIPPRMRVTRSPSGRLRLRCPKAEENGPCRGRVLIRHPRRGLVATGAFRIGIGRTATVPLRPPRRSGRGTLRSRVLVVVKARDRLGNAAVTRSRLRLRLR